MHLKHRSFQRRMPDRGAKKIYLVCEGEKREYDYFINFQGFDSRINVEVIAPRSTDDNSPTGLLTTARKLFVHSPQNQIPKHTLAEGDELWFVIDTDQWGDKISLLYQACIEQSGWEVAQSNPCFEVWLYYHFHETPSSEVGFEIAKTWKQMLDQDVLGGFDSKKHFLLIQTAILHASKCYSEAEGQPLLGATAVFKPAASIYQIAKQKIDRMLHQARS